MPLIDPVSGVGMAQASVGQAKEKSIPSHAIEPLDSDISRIFTHVHPILVLGIYYSSFSKLVADPVGALAVGLLPLIAVQVSWCMLCLPPAGSTAKGKGKKKGVSGTGAFKGNDARGKKADDVTLVEKIVPTLLSLFLTQLAVPFLLALQILLGAPLTTHLPETILSSAHMSLLAVFPLIFVHGAEASKWLEVAGLQCPFDEVFGSAVGVLLGSWLGAVPIPLDWDRAWQAWPITVVTGAYIGSVVGKTLGKWGLRGKRIPLE